MLDNWRIDPLINWYDELTCLIDSLIDIPDDQTALRTVQIDKADLKFWLTEWRDWPSN
jgi:hypothetical protein